MSFLDLYHLWPLLLALVIGAALLLSRKRKRRDLQRRQDKSVHQDGGTYVVDGGYTSGGRKGMQSDGYDADGGTDSGGGDGGGGDGGGGGGGGD